MQLRIIHRYSRSPLFRNAVRVCALFLCFGFSHAAYAYQWKVTVTDPIRGGPLSMTSVFPNPDPNYAYPGGNGPTAFPCDKLLFNPGASALSFSAPVNFIGDESTKVTVMPEEPLSLSKGFQVRPFKLSCGSEVLEVVHNGKRQALYTGVHRWSVSPSGKYLALQSVILRSNVWKNENRIIDIAKKTFVRIPLIACTYDFASAPWSGDRLITYAYDGSSRGGEICTWNLKGKNLARIRFDEETHTEMSPADSPFDRSHIGYISDSSDVFYAVVPQSYTLQYATADDPAASPGQHALTIVSTKKPFKNVVGLFTGATPQRRSLDFQLDFSKFSFEQPNVRYRLQSFEVMHDQEMFQQDGWSQWQQIADWK